MSMPCKALTALSALLILFLSACHTTPPMPTEFEAAPLLGMIYDAEGSPVAGARVRIDEEEELLSDINGRFFIPSVTRGDHMITVAKDGYIGMEIVFSFLNKSQIVYIQFYTVDQLYAEAKEAVAGGRIIEAREKIASCLLFDEDHIPSLFLQAIVHYREGDYSMAMDIVDGLERRGIKSLELYEFGHRIASEHLKDQEREERYRELIDKRGP